MCCGTETCLAFHSGKEFLSATTRGAAKSFLQYFFFFFLKAISVSLENRIFLSVSNHGKFAVEHWLRAGRHPSEAGMSVPHPSASKGTRWSRRVATRLQSRSKTQETAETVRDSQELHLQRFWAFPMHDHWLPWYVYGHPRSHRHTHTHVWVSTCAQQWRYRWAWGKLCPDASFLRGHPSRWEHRPTVWELQFLCQWFLGCRFF